MILRLAVRSLATRPLRTAVLAVGFGLGIAVMAELLGVGQVILEQAHSPALQGGGDLLVAGATGRLDSARFLLSSVLMSDRFRSRTVAASPSRRATVYLMTSDGAIAVSARGGIPSLEKAVGDPEIARQADWTDEPADAGWSNPPPGDVLRAMDRFHPIPAAGDGVSLSSWAEWLYFNGRTHAGGLRFYLTFLAGGVNASGKRPMIVRLQLDRGGRTTNYSATAEVDAAELLERAPEIEVGGNRVRIDGLSYRITLALQRERSGESRIPNPESRFRAKQSRKSSGESRIPNPESRLEGEIILDASPGRSLPPAAIHGARGWVSGYVVPVLSGTFRGTLHVDGEDVPVDGASGYHDHNWGFWEGVRWQWGQVAGGDISIVYGRVFPPATVADPDRIPGFLALLGPDGPIAFSTDVSIQETDDHGTPRTIAVRARGRQLNLELRLDVSESVRTEMAMTRTPGASAMGFLQLGGVYRVTGRAAERDIRFTARGSAETFRTAQ
jgi:hypothetical protein